MAIVIPYKHVPKTLCNCGSWLQHWKNCSGQSIFFCPVVNCLEKDFEGVQVIKTVNGNEKVFVIPLCARHAKSTKELQISDAYRLVHADSLMCCENLPLAPKIENKTKTHAE